MTLNETSATSQPNGSKPTAKELIVNELREIFAVMIYLWVSLSLLSTVKSLVLVQQGINDFAHGYQVAAVLALGAAKVVVVVQDLKPMRAWDTRPLIWAVLYKTTLMAIIVDCALKVEEKLFDHHAATQAAVAHPIVLMVAHQTVLFSIFAVLFLIRGLNRRLGPGKLSKLILAAPSQAEVA
ncbi:MAG: hypothetical protein Q8T09_24145 [Candidatus Melainabacteria bacterium]|nr:hypothetical protein [Candidatus Melainabacteria bacterium]